MKIFIVFFFLHICCYIKAQQTGIFEKTIRINNIERTLAYAVPLNYSSENEYALLVAFHGCTGLSGAAELFRNYFAFLTDSIDIIVVCPNAINSGVMDSAIIRASIDSTILVYNIDTTNVYLTGFSCNGHVALTASTNELYNWKGIIPYNAGFNIGYLSSGILDFNHKIPTCICIGSLDPSLGLTKRYRDSLGYYQTPYYYNEIPGVGHTLDFPEFNAEIMECFDWFYSEFNSVENRMDTKIDFLTFPNPVKDKLFIYTSNSSNYTYLNILDIYGKVLFQEKLFNNLNSVDISNFPNGIFIVRTWNEKKKIGERIIIKR